MTTKRYAATPIRRMNMKQLVFATNARHPEIIKRANSQCHIIRKEYNVGSRDGFKRDYNPDRTFYNEARMYSTCTDGKRISYVRFYGPPDPSTPAWVWCSCQYFCVEGSTLISTPEGLLPIEETIGDITTLTRDGGKEGVTFATGTADTLLLTTNDGFQIRATPNERFVVLTAELEQKWRRLDELQPGDHVALQPGAIWPEEPVKLPWTYMPRKSKPYKRMIAGKLREVKGHVVTGKTHETPTVMTSELARLLGYLVAEGSGDRNTVTFAQNEGPVLDNYRHCWEVCFPTAHLTLEKAHTEQGRRLTCRSVYLVAFLKSLGYTTLLKHNEKRVPRTILRSTKEHAIEFLKGYFEGDGTASSTQISCSTTSEKLAADLQKLLLALEVHTSNREHTPAKPYQNNKQRRITASGKNARKFLDDIGFAIRNYTADTSVGKHGRSFPFVRKMLRSCVQAAGYYTSPIVEGNRLRLKLWDHNIFSNYYEGGVTDSLTEYSLCRFMKGHGEDFKKAFPDKYERVQTLLDDNVEWVKIETIGDPKQVPTYDATVPEVEHFVANGFVVHNTYNLEVALARYNSSAIYLSNGQMPIVRNKQMFPHLCKHLVNTAKFALQQRDDLAAKRMESMEEAKTAAAKQQLTRMAQKPQAQRISKRQFVTPDRGGDLFEIS